MSPSNSFRFVKRFLNYAVQISRDLSWHSRMSSVSSRPVLSRIAEQSYLLINNAICAEDYYHLGLFEKTLPLAAKRTFLGSYEKWRYFNILNPPVYDILARDKALYHLLAHSVGLPTPPTVATLAPERKPHFGRTIHTREELRTFLLSGPAENLFFKPADGSLGEGALAIGRYAAQSSTWELLPEKSSISLEQLLERLTIDGKLVRVLVQERLKPHPTMAEILPEVCPTVRFMTLKTENGVEHLGAALRIGSGRGPTDNLAGGGILAPIDLTTGSILSTISLDHDMPQRLEKHPFTHAPMASLTIPDWNAVKVLVDRSAEAFSFLPCIGWDIGITDRGPIVIEINTRPRCVSVQSTRSKGLLDTAFGQELYRAGFLATGIRRPKFSEGLRR